MSKAIIKGNLHGAVSVPSSKSVAHRMLICAALADKPTTIVCSGYGKDVIATATCLNQLGADISIQGNTITVIPIKAITDGTRRTLNCGESGSTLRFLLPIAAVLGTSSLFIGEGRLPQRPLGPLYKEMTAHGVSMSPNATLPLMCDGLLEGGLYTLDGGVSSQFVSGLLMALPLASSDSRIIITGNRESTPYIDITINVLRQFGIKTETLPDGYQIHGGQHFSTPERITVEGDWSGAAFWLVAGCIGKEPITVNSISYQDSVQGDRHVVDVLRKMGAHIDCEDNCVTAWPSALTGIEYNCKDIPDLVPVLAVAASHAEGYTLFSNIERLRLKESDRIATVCSMLEAFGYKCSSTIDSMTIEGGSTAHSAEIDPVNDHRIAMAAAIMSTTVQGETIINGSECTDKSYPQFFNSFTELGGNCVII